MSRWGRGRGGSVAVPLDSALFRENSNCPTAARSAGTVGKWGITSFTSIRSAPYAYPNNTVKKPVQDQNSPLTVPAVESEQPAPKPKKFFKSRNAEQYPSVPQITYAPPVPAAPLSPEHPSNSKKDERGRSHKRSKNYNRDSSSPEIPRYREKTKTKKSLATKASRKEEHSSEDTQPPNKRYLVRNRNKIINYAEDGSNSPIPDIASYASTPPPAPPPKETPIVSSPINIKPDVKPDVVSPLHKDPSEERKPPPIVLRISKGTSRIVSTDSNEGFTSPSSDRHSSMDMHIEPDHKKSPIMETICSPKHEGLKITIKCSGLNQEISKKDKKKEKREGHKSHKRHHKNVDDESIKKQSSPVANSDTYDLYKTLASPVKESDSVSKHKPKVYEEIESELAKLDSEDLLDKSPSLDVQPTEPPPEPKPPENSTGRSRRNRPNINYNENDDYLDVITSGHLTKHSSKSNVDSSKKEFTRKTRKKSEAITEISTRSSSPEVGGIDDETESQAGKNVLLDILSGPDENGKSDIETQKLKVNKKHRHKNKQASPEVMKTAQGSHSDLEERGESASDLQLQDQLNMENQLGLEEEHQDFVHSQSQSQTNTPDTGYNTCGNEFPEDNLQVDNVFKSPRGMSDVEGSNEDKPSVKLVITKKKGSIFKSKSLVNDNPSPLPARKRRHLYKHEWANDGKGNETPRRDPEQADNQEIRNTAAPVSEELIRVTRYRVPDPVLDDTITREPVKAYTSVKCAKEAKEYYTVVRNVKKAHQIQEIGEFQEFNDDVDYLLDALQDNNPMSTRCLSAITLASKCTAPAFRMHVRAHGTVQKFFSALHDATNDQSLGLCTATVMFVLSQDRLNMDLDRESLELMLNLLESDVSHKNALDDCGLTSAQLTKTQERVRELCAEIKNQGKAQHLDLDNITVGHLAMETLLSLTSKRAGEWFKEELRVLGGVDHIVRTIQDCASRLTTSTLCWSQADLDTLRKADRCMRVLENVTQQNEENQLYLVSGERVGVAGTLASLLRLCVNAARSPAHPTVLTALLDAALPAIKVLVNLSHSFGLTASLGASIVGEHVSIMELCLIILHNPGNFVPDNSNFEFSVCVLLLLINLVQNNLTNTERLLELQIHFDVDGIETKLSALDLIVQHFYKREELAKRAEENTDAILDGEGKEMKNDEKEKKKQSQDDIDETVAKLLAKAGAHMEHSMVGAYAALLLGHVAVVAPALAEVVRRRIGCYAPLLPTLRKYYTFLALTASMSRMSCVERVGMTKHTDSRDSERPLVVLLAHRVHCNQLLAAARARRSTTMAGLKLSFDECHLAIHSGVLIPYTCVCMCGVSLKDKCRNNDVRELCGLKKDVVTRAEATIVAHVKATQRIIDFMEASDREHQPPPVAPHPPPANSPSDMPQDMSLSNLAATYDNLNYSTSSSDRLSSSMEIDNYH
ncbi:Protein wings apart-like [Eumeta japonica]|uniref:Protein wings apart-like n=1 Tax=Eumeta variegata TaxID=151549 RepID=A0A4C1SWH1_EUMVA|nr:Protein wings apart-like [Eumeta japonica]